MINFLSSIARTDDSSITTSPRTSNDRERSNEETSRLFAMSNLGCRTRARDAVPSGSTISPSLSSRASSRVRVSNPVIFSLFYLSRTRGSFGALDKS